NVTMCSINYLTALKTALYVPLGGGAALTNFILIAAILRKPSLRSKREYLLTAALAIADFVEGIATCVGGIYRLPHVYSRTLCHDYVIFFMVAWIKPISMTIRGIRVPAVCGTSGFIDQTLVQVTKYVGSLGSAVSVFISIIVAIKIRGFIARIEVLHMDRTAFGARDKGSAKRQLKFTITTLIKGLCTLVLDSFPRSYGVYSMIREQIDGYNPENGGIGSFFFILTKVNAMLNVFIYALRQPE
ncbi:hypothetical protein PFISCL1PPCAC_5609, partial [Pristionchus fissidentatus]